MDENTRKVGRPVTQKKVIQKTSQIGTKENEIRATFILKEDLLEKVKAMAYWHRVQIKEIAHHAFADAIEKYEKWNGPISPIPRKRSE